MKAPQTSFYEWQRRYASERACLDALHRLRWPDGFRCPHCAAEHGYFITTRRVYECTACHRQTSITAGTVFHATKLSLVKWFWALYWVSSDKGSISALRLAKLLGIQWRSAALMLNKLRTAMGHQDSLYRLHGLIELDDCYFGSNKTGKTGRGGGRTTIMVAIENHGGRPGFVAIEVIESLAKAHVAAFARRRLAAGACARTDGFRSLAAVAPHAEHEPRNTPPELAKQWLPWVHIVISNLKRFLLGTFHGAVRRRRLQRHIDEFVYRFNRRFWEAEIPNRLLRLCVSHAPAVVRGT